MLRTNITEFSVKKQQKDKINILTLNLFELYVDHRNSRIKRVRKYAKEHGKNWVIHTLKGNARATGKLLIQFWLAELRKAKRLTRQEQELPCLDTVQTSLAKLRGIEDPDTITNHIKRLKLFGVILSKYDKKYKRGVKLLLNPAMLPDQVLNEFQLPDYKDSFTSKLIKVRTAIVRVASSDEGGRRPAKAVPIVCTEIFGALRSGENRKNIKIISECGNEEYLTPPAAPDAREEQREQGGNKGKQTKKPGSAKKIEETSAPNSQNDAGTEVAPRPAAAVEKPEIDGYERICTEKEPEKPEANQEAAPEQQKPTIADHNRAFRQNLVLEVWNYARQKLWPECIFAENEQEAALQAIEQVVFNNFSVMWSRENWQNYQQGCLHRIDLAEKWMAQNPWWDLMNPYPYFTQKGAGTFAQTLGWHRKDVFRKQLAKVKYELASWRKGKGPFKHKTGLELYNLQLRRLTLLNDQNLLDSFAKLATEGAYTRRTEGGWLLPNNAFNPDEEKVKHTDNTAEFFNDPHPYLNPKKHRSEQKDYQRQGKASSAGNILSHILNKKGGKA